MAANNQIGSGAVVLTATADPLVNGLNQAEKRVEAWAAKSQAAVNAGAAKLSGGAMKGLLPGGTEAVGAALGGLLKKFGDAFEATKLREFNDEMERTGRLSAQLDKAADRRAGRIFAAADALGPGQSQIDFLQKEIEKAEREKEGIARQLNSSRNNLAEERGDGTWKETRRAFIRDLPIVSAIPFVKSSLDLPEQKLKAEVEEAAKRYDRAGDAVQRLRDKLEDARKATVGPGAFANLAAAGLQMAADAAKQLQADVGSLNQSLRIQAETFGMSGTQAQIATLKLRGASEEMLKGAEMRAAHLERLQRLMDDNGPKLAGAVEAGSQAAVAAGLQVRGFDVGDSAAVHRDNGKKLDKIAELNSDFNKKMEELIGAMGDPF